MSLIDYIKEIKEINEIRRRAGLSESDTFGDMFDKWASNYASNVKKSFQELGAGPGSEIETQYLKPSTPNQYVHDVIEKINSVFVQYESTINSLLQSDAYRRSPRDKQSTVKEKLDMQAMNLIANQMKRMYTMMFVQDDDDTDEEGNPKYPYMEEDIWDDVSNWVAGKISMLGLPEDKWAKLDHMAFKSAS